MPQESTVYSSPPRAFLTTRVSIATPTPPHRDPPGSILGGSTLLQGSLVSLLITILIKSQI